MRSLMVVFLEIPVTHFLRSATHIGISAEPIDGARLGAADDCWQRLSVCYFVMALSPSLSGGFNFDLRPILFDGFFQICDFCSDFHLKKLAHANFKFFALSFQNKSA
ncbi:hypothetical protein BpHYR1_046936 [Brachionus plicatilis]|uniref:Uncharacterized protein n=1 Tax=Brachionus plicatilis TaxID=10195 RepID=A0A3M7RGH7_BRAPC|nr:hypothetical protein BpHYR1_046936 [Brachionus plicatilis]